MMFTETLCIFFGLLHVDLMEWYSSYSRRTSADLYKYKRRSCHMRLVVAMTPPHKNMPRDTTTCPSNMLHEVKSVWIQVTHHSNKMSHMYSVPSCGMHMRHVAVTTITKPIMSLSHDAILMGNLLQRHAAASSHILCRVCDFVAGTCHSDKLPRETLNHITWKLMSCVVGM